MTQTARHLGCLVLITAVLAGAAPSKSALDARAGAGKRSGGH